MNKLFWNCFPVTHLEPRRVMHKPWEYSSHLHINSSEVLPMFSFMEEIIYNKKVASLPVCSTAQTARQ